MVGGSVRNGKGFGHGLGVGYTQASMAEVGISNLRPSKNAFFSNSLGEAVTGFLLVLLSWSLTDSPSLPRFGGAKLMSIMRAGVCY